MSAFTLSWTCTATREPADWQPILLTEQEHEIHMAGHSLSREKEGTTPALLRPTIRSFCSLLIPIPSYVSQFYFDWLK